MHIPFEPVIFGVNINVHLILEYLAFFVGFRYYVFLKKGYKDQLNSAQRLTIILGAVIGALIGSRLFAFLENPDYALSQGVFYILFESKTIMGGLFGGLLGVELIKKYKKVTSSSGDLFTLPIIIAIAIGRVGCFLTGTNEFTYGSETSFFTGMNLGDNVMRHPTALYEIIFLLLTFTIFYKPFKSKSLKNGNLFIIFMLLYFGFRFFIEFIKPNTYFTLGLSSIQWLCILCYLYYFNFLKSLFKFK